jgi:hypothetical protein
MFEIKGLKNGNVEYWDNKEGIKDFLKQNRGYSGAIFRENVYEF